MDKLQRLKRIVCLIYAILNSLILAVLIFATFLPFYYGENFYVANSGSLGDFLPMAHPYFLLLLPVVASVLCYFTHKKRALVIISPLINVAFYFLTLFPVSLFITLKGTVEGAVTGSISANGLGSGYYIISNMSKITICFGLIFVIFNVIVELIPSFKKRK